MVAVAALVVCGGVVLAACGGEDFENEPRPPVPVQLTGVVTDARVTVSPARLGAGPIVLTISNQTKASHIVVLEGTGTLGTEARQVRERVGPVNPGDTATIQKTLLPGRYEVQASSNSRRTGIDPALLTIGPARPSGKDELLLP